PIYIGHEIASINNKKTALELIALRYKDQPDETRRQLLLQELKAGQDFLQQQRLAMQDLIANHQDEVAEHHSDTNYIFLHFVRHYLPAGMVGLLFAIIFLASWSSISAAINALASSSLIDFHQVLFTRSELSEGQQLRYGRLYTMLWGLFSIAVAMFATRMGSLIEAVNELGSLFYGAILGIFLTAFFLKRVQGRAVFFAAVLSEI